MLSCIKCMPKSLIFTYLLSALLFSYHQSQPPRFATWRKQVSCPWYKAAPTNKKDQIQILKKSFLCGDKKGLKRKIRKAYKNLNLYHLFTPSGIHLGIFYLMNSPILKYLGKKSGRIQLIYKILLSIWPWFLGGFYSLKRIGGMHLLKMFPVNMSPRFTFFCFFTFDFFLGTYKLSPLSWSFSFLFLGIVFHTYKKSFLSFSLYLFSGQLLASIFSYQNIFPLSFFPSFILTTLFTPVFIVLFMNNILNIIHISLLENISNWFVGIFNEVVILTNSFIVETVAVKPEVSTLLFTLALLIKNKKLIAISLILHSSRIYNLPDARARQSAYVHQNDFYFNDKIIKTTYDKRGTIKIEFKNKRKCSLKILNYGKTKSCRFKEL
jgi:hypothetical protein